MNNKRLKFLVAIVFFKTTLSHRLNEQWPGLSPQNYKTNERMQLRPDHTTANSPNDYYYDYEEPENIPGDEYNNNYIREENDNNINPFNSKPRIKKINNIQHQTPNLEFPDINQFKFPEFNSYKPTLNNVKNLGLPLSVEQKPFETHQLQYPEIKQVLPGLGMPSDMFQGLKSLTFNAGNNTLPGNWNSFPDISNQFPRAYKRF